MSSRPPTGTGKPGTAGGKSAPATRVVGGHVVTQRVVAVDEETPSMARAWAIPLTLLGIGLVVRTVQVLQPPPAPLEAQPVIMAIFWMLLGFVLGTACVVGGVLAVASFFGTDLDDGFTLARKCVGIVVFTVAVAAFLALFDKEPGGIRGLLVGAHATLLLYFVLLAWLLKMDLLEALATTVVATAIQIAVLLVIGKVVTPQIARLIFF